MIDITILKKQHSELTKIASQIIVCVNENCFPSNADDISRLLNTLAAIASIHLRMEDQMLYPDLLESGNEEAAEKAREFKDKMGAIKEAFATFTLKWTQENAVKDSPEKFREESRDVFDSLLNRITRENVELFPLITA